MTTDGTRKSWCTAVVCLVTLAFFGGCAGKSKGAHNGKSPPPPTKTLMDDIRAHARDIKHKGIVSKQLVRYLVARRMYVLAIHHAEELIEKDPKDADLYALKGYALREGGRHEEAVEALKTALHLKKGFAEAWNALGMAYDLMRKPGEAERAYLEALRINPTSPKYLNNIGFSLFGRGQYDRAAEYYRKALASDPLNVQIHNNLGFAYGMLGSYPEAIAEFKQAGRDEVVYNNLGFLYFMLGFNDEARVMYAKALEINPQFIRARKNLRLIDGDTNGRFPRPEHMGKLKP